MSSGIAGNVPPVQPSLCASAEGGGILSRFDESFPRSSDRSSVSSPASSFDGGVQSRAVVKWFNAGKGFGFVSPEDGSTDAFLHISVLNRIGRHDIGDGADVLCRIVDGGKGPQVSEILEVLSEGTPAAGAPPARRPAPSGPETDVSGTVKWFKADKGFGFVVADDGLKDVFVHKSVLRRCHLLHLDPGQRVHMRVQEADKGREATWVALA